MRKIVAVLLAATLLSVSSVPAFAEAASCAGPEAVVMDVDGHAHHHAAAVDQADLGHDHTSGLFSDWQQDRIECGCGCHRSVESLPHLLAPHLIDSALLPVTEEEGAVVARLESARGCLLLRVSLPPPQIIA